MENKINIKELAKNLKNLKNLPLTEGVKEKEPIVVAKTETSPIAPKAVEKKPKPEPKPQQVKPKSEIYQPAVKEELITTLQTDLEAYDFSKQVWIDEEIYEILVHIKRREKIKNISILVTSIIEQYINQNKAAIVRLLNDKPKKF